ncbi:MAG: ribosome-associated translation inhibitor RaiA, partial [Acidobacteriota bacterium]
MNIEYTGRNQFELTDDIKDYFEKKLNKLGRFLEEPVEIHLILAEEKERQVAELNVVHRHGDLHSQTVAEDMRDAVLAVVETTAKQARRARKKFMGQRRRTDRQMVEEAHWQAAQPSGGAGYDEYEEHWPVDVIDAATLGHEEGPKIVKTHRLPIKPMSISEASVELQNSKNDFFVFLDSSS